MAKSARQDKLAPQQLLAPQHTDHFWILPPELPYIVLEDQVNCRCNGPREGTDVRALSAGDSRAVCSPWPMPGTGKKRSALAIWSHTSANDCSAADSSCTAQRSVIFRNRHHCSACLLLKAAQPLPSLLYSACSKLFGRAPIFSRRKLADKFPTSVAGSKWR